ncbi:MAG: hypothetical protein CL868_09775 [Cytophagaceae bacterium]|nr:hypothetical protein [Cytophagaceae bacterium]
MMKQSIFILIILFSSVACNNVKTEKIAPAEVKAPVKEAELTTIKLTEKAVSRLGIESYTVEEKKLGGVFKTGGQMLATPGKSASIVSPLQGTLVLAGKQEPQPGREVKKGQILYRVVILPAEKDLVSVKQEVTSLASQLENAKRQAERTSQLLNDGAVSEKQNEQAKDNLAVAQQAYNDAKTRYSLLKNGSSGNVGNKATYAIEAPMDGIIQQVYVSSGQTITAGIPIIDIAAVAPLWVKVPIYSGDVSSLTLSQPATIQKLGNPLSGRAGSNSKISVKATIATSPVTKNGSSLTDVFYAIDNGDRAFLPGEKVNVFLPKETLEKNIAVPYSAVLYDYNGGEWVYVRTKPQTFVRTRINVSHVINQMAVITDGLKLGDKVVTLGAPELFGTEFNSGK